MQAARTREIGHEDAVHRSALFSTAALLNTQGVVVIGGTPGGGIVTAVTAARLGHSVTLVEYHRRIGGMSASDIENRAIQQGVELRKVPVGRCRAGRRQ